MNRGELPPSLVAALDQDLAAAEVDLDMIIEIYRHALTLDGDIQAMVATSVLLAGAPTGALIGMLITALRRWA